MLSRLSKPLAAVTAALMLALSFPTDALARPGGGGSFGSRGSKTFSAPPVTSTAPRSAAPIERQSAPSPNPGSFAQQPSRSGGFLSSGFGRGLVGGLVGAGIFGLLSGNGFFGGLGDGMSFIGLLIQIGLVVLIVRLLIGFFRRRQQQPAYGGASSGQSAFVSGGPTPDNRGYSRGGGSAPATQPLQTDSADFDTFQRRLGEVQGAYGAEDIGFLRRIATPEMATLFAEEIGGNQQRGVSNRLSDVRLLQGDLAEAWREGNDEYATVAMRYTLVDVMVERSSGRLVSGSTDRPSEVTELWTFVRRTGSGSDGWILSAIQQT